MDMSTNHRTGNVNRHVQVQIAAYQIIGERHRGYPGIQCNLRLTHISTDKNLDSRHWVRVSDHL